MARLLVFAALGTLVLVLVAQLGQRTAARVSYPWDTIIWSESPFMTAMWKLTAGEPLFGPAADANSFVYSPGLEYLTYALLRPFGLQLDVRWCRALNTGIGGAAAVVFAVAAFLALRAGGWPRLRAGLASALGGGVALLVLSRNFTADVLHPDNLVLLHVLGTFTLTCAAVQRRSMRFAAAALVLAAFGLWAKQILLLSLVGVTGALLQARVFPRAVLFRLGACAALAATLSAALLFSNSPARFWLLDVLSRHAMRWWKAPQVLAEFFVSWRGVMVLAAVVAGAWAWRRRLEQRPFLITWLWLGAFTAAPTFLARLKVMGTWNNLILLEVWFLLLAWPMVWLALDAFATAESSRRRLSSAVLAVAMASGLAIYATDRRWDKMPPNAALLRGNDAIQRRISADVALGRKILLSHGTAYLLHAGSPELPRDRANSLLELRSAGLSAPATAERVATRFYDRIYLIEACEWYGDELIELIGKNYLVVEKLAAPDFPYHDHVGGWQGLLRESLILERRP